MLQTFETIEHFINDVVGVKWYLLTSVRYDIYSWIKNASNIA